MRSGVILVDVSEGSGVPSNIDQLGFYTRNDGSRWHKTVAHYGGYQMGVITDAGMAEAWDSHYYVGWPYGKYPQEIGFHITPLN